MCRERYLSVGGCKSGRVVQVVVCFYRPVFGDDILSFCSFLICYLFIDFLRCAIVTVNNLQTL